MPVFFDGAHPPNCICVSRLPPIPGPSEQPRQSDASASLSTRGYSGGAAHLQRPLHRLDAHLGGRDSLVGRRFTVAEVMLAECLRYGAMHKPLLDPFPAVAAWLARCQAQPAYQKLWAARLA